MLRGGTTYHDALHNTWHPQQVDGVVMTLWHAWEGVIVSHLFNF